jgi:hypothetical protein
MEAVFIVEVGFMAAVSAASTMASVAGVLVDSAVETLADFVGVGSADSVGVTSVSAAALADLGVTAFTVGGAGDIPIMGTAGD